VLAAPLGLDPLLGFANLALWRHAALGELDRELLAVAAERSQPVAETH